MRHSFIAVLAASLILIPVVVRAGSGPPPGRPSSRGAADTTRRSREAVRIGTVPGAAGCRNNFEDQARNQINGKKIPYTATAGTLVLKKDDGKPWASMFYVAYTRDDVHGCWRSARSHSRSTAGPGSSSVWLHMGALGPKRVAMGPEGEQPTPPYRWWTTRTPRWSSPTWCSSIR